MKRMLKKIFFLWFLCLIFCLVIPPLFHRTEEPEDRIKNAEYNYSTGQEKTLILDENTEALTWRLRLIENAQERIVLVTFEFWDDHSGTDIMAALLNAADRGVRVQILIDGISGVWHLGRSGHFRELTGHPNVEVRIYNPVNLLMPWRVNYRMHDKYLIADNFAYILGGRNTGDLFLGSYAESYNEDRDILVYEMVPGEGSSYCQLIEYFEQIWVLPCCKAYKGYGKATDELEGHYLWMRQEYPDAYSDVDWQGETRETGSLALLSGQIDPCNKAPKLWQALLDKMRGEKDILIITPYIICGKDMYQDIETLSEDGTEIQFLINAVESGANPFGCTDYLNQKSHILETGVGVCEYWGEQSLHTKTILIGDHTSIVGSCNIDMRSIYLDTELMLVIEDSEINRELRTQAENLQFLSLQTSSDGTQRIGDGYMGQPLPLWKKTIYRILRVLIIPFRHLL